MTENIDLDDVDVASESEEDDPARGAWFWDGEGDAGDGPDPPDDEMRDEPVPRVPRENESKPAGIPVESGGAGAGAGVGDDVGDGGVPGDDTAEHGGGTRAAGSAAHDASSDPDDMTMALTFDAVQRLANPRRVLADAGQWADWIGIVGDVEAHVINSFQREHDLDVDFFNGSGTDPGERLAAIGEHSMFYSRRMVVVGGPEAERIADAADWEHVSLAEAAGEAGWDLAE